MTDIFGSHLWPKTFDFSFQLQVPEEGVSGITEECFRQTVLTYDGDYQWVQYGLDQNNRTAFEAQRTTEGTTPAGATWTKVRQITQNSKDR